MEGSQDQGKLGLTYKQLKHENKQNLWKPYITFLSSRDLPQLSVLELNYTNDSVICCIPPHGEKCSLEMVGVLECPCVHTNSQCPKTGCQIWDQNSHVFSNIEYKVNLCY